MPCHRPAALDDHGAARNNANVASFAAAPGFNHLHSVASLYLRGYE